jgi:hypothetical protein
MCGCSSKAKKELGAEAELISLKRQQVSALEEFQLRIRFLSE